MKTKTTDRPSPEMLRAIAGGLNVEELAIVAGYVTGGAPKPTGATRAKQKTSFRVIDGGQRFAGGARVPDSR